MKTDTPKSDISFSSTLIVVQTVVGELMLFVWTRL